MHDTGYIQDDTDKEGTGAKYTTSHVERSVKFLQKNYKALEINPDDIMIYTDMIHCTGLMVRIEAVPFSSDEEKIAGCMLGTADLLGQMSDRAYLEKLLFLYYEFKEAGVKGFESGTWNAVAAPPKTPAAVGEKLNAAINDVLKSPEAQKHFADINLHAAGGTPAEAAAFIARETKVWGDVIKAAGVPAN